MNVPCNGCRICCLSDAVRLLPEDDAGRYQTVPHFKIPGALMLDHKHDGGCIYLDDHGCSIQDRKPTLCRSMDCRVVAGRLSFTEARKLANAGKISMSLWRRGRELMKVDIK